MKIKASGKIPVVILCGGKGTRLGRLSDVVPKPLLPVGEKPILWHVMKIYASQGYTDFILCLGHKKTLIERYFRKNKEGWNIRFVDTGVDATKARRIRRIEKWITTQDFFLAYGDDVADIDLSGLLAFHRKMGRAATITAVRMVSPFGMIKMNASGRILEFQEKPRLDVWMNGGFMCMNRRIFKDLDMGELEDDIFKKWARARDIGAYCHKGQWKTMNTLKDNMELTALWRSGHAFWKIWED